MIPFSPMGNSQANRGDSASAPPLPGGYALQEITSRTVSLLERAGVPMPEILAAPIKDIHDGVGNMMQGINDGIKDVVNSLKNSADPNHPHAV